MTLEPNPPEMILRAIADLRAGVPVVVRCDDADLVALATETGTDARTAELLADGAILAITARRAAGMNAMVYDDDLARIEPPSNATVRWVRAVSDPTQDLAHPMKGPFSMARGGAVTGYRMALALCKMARLLPAALVGVAQSVPDTLTVIDAAEIEAALPAFRGEIMQTPPLFSAVKVDGERAYDIARRGETAELKARPLTVHRLELLATPDPDHAVIEMVCGKGGYVRSIARDLGQALGCHGHVASLRRLASGGFDLEGALGFEALEALKTDPDRDDHLLAVEEGLGDAPEIEVPASIAERIDHGDNAAVPAIDAPVYWLSYDGAPLAIVEREGAAPPKLKRVFRFEDEG